MDNTIDLGFDRKEAQSEKVFNWMIEQLLSIPEQTKK
jgi:hypothetical protein